MIVLQSCLGKWSAVIWRISNICREICQAVETARFTLQKIETLHISTRTKITTREWYFQIWKVAETPEVVQTGVTHIHLRTPAMRMCITNSTSWVESMSSRWTTWAMSWRESTRKAQTTRVQPSNSSTRPAQTPETCSREFTTRTTRSSIFQTTSSPKCHQCLSSPRTPHHISYSIGNLKRRFPRKRSISFGNPSCQMTSCQSYATHCGQTYVVNPPSSRTLWNRYRTPRYSRSMSSTCSTSARWRTRIFKHRRRYLPRTSLLNSPKSRIRPHKSVQMSFRLRR